MKPIKGYEGLYSITEDGRVFTHYQNKYMKTFINNSGYEVASLVKDRKKKKHLVHRLVAEAYLGDGEGKEVNHINSIKTDNNVNNLEWVTRKENVRHSIEQGNFNVELAQKKAKEANKRKVAQYTLDGKLVAVFDSQKEAGEKTGSSPSKISLVVNGKRETHNNFIWRRVHDIV